MKKVVSIILIFFLFSCASQKHIETSKTKSNTSTKIDSAYIDSLDSQTKTIRAIRINFDSSGKPTQADIKQVVVESKKTIKTGALKKDVEESKIVKETIKDKEKINLTPLIIGGAVIAFFILLIVILMVYLVHKLKR